MPASALFKLDFSRNASLPIIAGLVILAVALGFIFRQPLVNQLNAWKLLPQPERLTELYFTQPNNLPATYRPGSTQTVGFVVHNLEYRTAVYPYQIAEIGQNGSTSQLASGSFSLKQNQSRTINAVVPLADLGARVKITISLPTFNESINYWVARRNA